MLGFKCKGSYSNLPRDAGTNKYITQWENNEKYMECDPNHCMLVLSSFKMTIPPENKMSTDSKVLPQNILYCTDLNRATSDVLAFNGGAGSDRNRLFLNTHKICTYKSPKIGVDYLLYCYCCYHPDKLIRQLVLGYAPYYIDKDNDYNIVLLTKTEFRDKNGDRFGWFPNCSRIISMDCKNGHLWITWMRSGDVYYYVFHIKAEDLIGD